jgi:phosphoribosylamine--glycine ligase
MNRPVLVLGSGGREHALAWRLSQSESVSHVIAAPGNEGFEFKRWEADLSLGKSEFERLALKAKEEGISLVVIGPDNALAEGAADIFEKHGLACFGPSEKAAKIESSKTFAKDVMKAAGVPTARYFVASSVLEAQKILKSVPWPKMGGWVVKADGLAFGKGVQVCPTYEDAMAAASQLIEISGSLVIEEMLQGEELSWFAFCDGEDCALFEPARDFKRLETGDLGPNTGGMGAFSPVPGIPAAWTERVCEEVFKPTLREMKKRGTPFKGLLYAGLMCDLKRDLFWVIEFNARFGDPETQVLLPRMTDDFYEWCLAVSQGKVKEHARMLGRDLNKALRVGFSRKVAVGVVAAARGYPLKPEKGQKLTRHTRVVANDFNRAPSYFYAGVSADGADLLSAGGRVYLALGVQGDFEGARKQAYANLSGLRFEGMQFRTDIAQGVES